MRRGLLAFPKSSKSSMHRRSPLQFFEPMKRHVDLRRLPLAGFVVVWHHDHEFFAIWCDVKAARSSGCAIVPKILNGQWCSFSKRNAWACLDSDRHKIGSAAAQTLGIKDLLTIGRPYRKLRLATILIRYLILRAHRGKGLDVNLTSTGFERVICYPMSVRRNTSFGDISC